MRYFFNKKKEPNKTDYYEGNVCNIYIDNIIWMNNGYEKCLGIMKDFVKEEEQIIFTLYMNDGLNLEKSDFSKQYIHNYIKENGQIISVHKDYNYCGYVPNSKMTWDLIPSITKHYLESIFFASKKPFDTFKDLYVKHPMERAAFYIQAGIADIIFLFIDSGDFCISFNTDVYSVASIKEFITKRNFDL